MRRRAGLDKVHPLHAAAGALGVLAGRASRAEDALQHRVQRRRPAELAAGLAGRGAGADADAHASASNQRADRRQREYLQASGSESDSDFDDGSDSASEPATAGTGTGAGTDHDEWERIVAELGRDIGGDMLPRSSKSATAAAAAAAAAAARRQQYGNDVEDDIDYEDQDPKGVAETRGVAFAPPAADPRAEMKLQLVSRKLRQFKERYLAMRAARDLERTRARVHEERVEELRKEHEEKEAEWERKNRSGVMFGQPTGRAAAEAEARRRKREEQRRKLFMQSAAGDDDDALDEDTAQTLVQQLVERLRRFVRRRMPLQKELRSVEARYGTSVSAYFAFLRWIVINYVFLGAVCIASFVLHVMHLYNAPNVNLSDELTLEGLLPRVVLISSYQADEAFGYAAVLVGCNFLLLLLTLRKWVTEDFRAKEKGIYEGEVSSKHSRFARLVLNAWDFTQSKSDEVSDMRFAIADSISTTLHEERLKQQAQRLTGHERAVLYARRFAGLIAFTLIQASSWWALVTLTGQSQSIEQKLPSYLSSVAASVVPALASIINAVMPPLITLITGFERWQQEGFKMKMMVTRLYLAKIFNAGIQMFSYILLVDPIFFVEKELSLFGGIVDTDAQEVRASVELKYNPESRCRAEQAGAGLTILVVTEFLISKIIMFTVPLAMKALAKARGKPYTKDEFHIPQSMVSLLYFQTLLIMVFPFSPATGILGGLFLFANFHFERYILHTFQQKSKKPWNAKDAGKFFIYFYFITVVSSIALTHYFLTLTSYPKECSRQDAGVGLCAGAVTNKVCTLTASSAKHSYFAEQSNCPEKYPKCVCDGALACGPFAQTTSGYAKVTEWLASGVVLPALYSGGNSVWLLWIILIWLLLRGSLNGNTLHLIRDVNESKEQEYKSIVQALEKKIRIQNRSLEAHRKVQAEAEA